MNYLQNYLHSFTFDERFKLTLVPFLIPDFNLLSFELDKFPFKCYIESFYIKQNKITILLQYLVKNLQ